MKLGLYIHVPFCYSKCHYCDFLSFPNTTFQTEYVQVLVQELKNYADKLGKEDTIQSIFIGGGTPTVLPPVLLEKICNAIVENFVLDTNAEWTIEANPGTLRKDHIQIINQYRITRISLGLQSADKDLLQLLGRAHTFEMWEDSIKRLRNDTNVQLNTDIMFALPTQTVEQLEDTLEKVSAYEIDHISLYSLILEEGTHFYSLYEQGKIELATDEKDREMYYLAKKLLKQKGFIQYELSNWAKPGKECTHNKLYWTRKSYIGVGLGAHSLLNEQRYHNVEKLQTYLQTKGDLHLLQQDKNSLTIQEQMEEFLFLGLRMTKGISITDFKQLFGKSISSIYGEIIEKWIKQNILVQTKDRIYLSDYGMDICNQVFASFL